MFLKLEVIFYLKYAFFGVSDFSVEMRAMVWSSNANIMIMEMSSAYARLKMLSIATLWPRANFSRSSPSGGSGINLCQ